MSLLKGNQPSDWRESMYYRYYYSHFETEPHYGVRTYDHKLIYFNRIDQWELYDLNKDPSEMNNLYGNPEYQEITKQLKSELIRLQNELDDDPSDDGSNPNLGKLGPNPMHTLDELLIGTGEKTILVRFKSMGGGTLFSQTNLNENSFEDDSWEGDKTLFIQNSSLFFTDSREEIMAEKNFVSEQWYNLAFVVQDNHTLIYIDGQLEIESDRGLSANRSGQTFNIGAGLSGNGSNGYNFVGEINHVTAYDRVLDEEEIMSHMNGNMPDETAVFKWVN